MLKSTVSIIRVEFYFEITGQYRMTEPRQVRDWCFTINNPEDSDYERLNAVCEGEFKADVAYMVYQRERGENGTMHLQGFIIFRKQRSFAWVKEFLGERAHIEKRKKSRDEAANYCKKLETRVEGTEPVEYGTIPIPGGRSDISSFRDAIMVPNCRNSDLLEVFPDNCAKYPKFISFVRNACQCVRDWKTNVNYYYGDPGTGKSLHANREAKKMCKNVYYKAPGKWWDGYESTTDTAVIMDDFLGDKDDNGFGLREFLAVTDRYPTMIETKGSTQQFVAQYMWITSNFPPSDLYTENGMMNNWVDIKTAIFRRLDSVIYFVNPKALSTGDKNEVIEAIIRDLHVCRVWGDKRFDIWEFSTLKAEYGLLDYETLKNRYSEILQTPGMYKEELEQWIDESQVTIRVTIK